MRVERSGVGAGVVYDRVCGVDSPTPVDDGWRGRESMLRCCIEPTTRYHSI